MTTHPGAQHLAERQSKDLATIQDLIDGTDWLGTSTSAKNANQDRQRCEAAWSRIREYLASEKARADAAEVERDEIRTLLEQSDTFLEAERGLVAKQDDTIASLTEQLAEARDAKAKVRLWSEQSPEPVPTHGGLAVATYWHLDVEGVEIGREMDRRRWCPDRTKYTEIEWAPQHLRSLFEKLCAALSRLEKQEGEA